MNKQAGIKNLNQAIKDVKHNKMMLDKMKGLAVDSVQKGNKPYGHIAGSGMNEYSKALDFSKAILKDEAKKAAKGVGAVAGVGAGVVVAGKAIKKRKAEKTAFDIVDETFEKMAGITDYRLRFTKDNPNKATKEEFDEYVALGAKVDAGNIAPEEMNRFKSLAVKIPDRYLSFPHFEKKK